jgi:hypothetical protein
MRAARSERWSPFPPIDSSREASTGSPRSHSPGHAIGADDWSAGFDIWEPPCPSTQMAAAVIQSWAASGLLGDGSLSAGK